MISLGDIYLGVKESEGVKELRQMPFGVFPACVGLIGPIPPIIPIPRNRG